VITGVCVVRAGARGRGAGVSNGRAVVRGRGLRASKSKTHTGPALGSVDEQLTTGSRQLATASEITLVTMSELSDADIREYVATGEPMDKAGAYAIQGIASRWIPRIEGDYSNVVGLPVALVYRMLGEQGAL